MNPVSPITNRHQEFRIHNLAQLLRQDGARGPFIVTQDGSDPGDPRMRPCSFVLTRRGTWLHFYLYLALSNEARAHCVQFESAADALHAAASLPDMVRVENAVSLQELLLEAGFQPGPPDPAGRALLEAVRQRPS